MGGGADQSYVLPDIPVNVCVPVLASLCLVTRIEMHVTPADGLYLLIDPCLSIISCVCTRVLFRSRMPQFQHRRPLQHGPACEAD
jgi:hypothetical protein